MEEVRYGVIGNVDSGKSTLIGVIVGNELDDGRGKARTSILRHPHEKKSGRTSSISQNFMKLNEKKYLNFVDLAGHEKYLKTTIKGITGYYIDYAIIVVGANMGVSYMTREHLSIALAIKLPFIIVITKMDLAPKNVYDNTIKDLFKCIHRRAPTELTPRFMNKVNVKGEVDTEKEYPIFCISNKTGKNIENLRYYLGNLNTRFKIEEQSSVFDNVSEFTIDKKYNVNGVGMVVSGKVTKGRLVKNDKMYIGPHNGVWLQVNLKSFHDNFRNEVDSIESGESGCISIKFIHAKKDEINNFNINSGMILTKNSDLSKKHVHKFTAKVLVLNSHSTTIKENYQPLINCNRIAQCAKICSINKDVIRGGDRANVKFRFIYKPEYVRKNDYFVFREGKTRGLGLITEVG
jgi:small GTP-binding protein